MEKWKVGVSNESVPACASEKMDLSTSFAVVEKRIKENLAIEKYNQLLYNWAYDKACVSDINADFPEFYGGAYIDDDKNLVIQVTELDESVENCIEDIIDIENVEFEVVEYSFARLMEEKQKIEEKAWNNSKNRVTSIVGVGLDIYDNEVEVYLCDADTAFGVYPLSENVVSDFEHISYQYVDEEDRPAEIVFPGGEISSGGSSRSVGFWAENSSGQVGIVTAPHDTLSARDTVYVGNTAFGIAETPYFSGNVDGVFIRRTNTNFTPSRYVQGGGFSLVADATTTLPVGATTYSYGKASKYQEGIIQTITYTTSYGISNVVVTSAPSVAGDSGGIVAGSGTTSSRYVAGIITGRQGGTGYLMYIRANGLLSRLGVSVY